MHEAQTEEIYRRFMDWFSKKRNRQALNVALVNGAVPAGVAAALTGRPGRRPALDRLLLRP